MKPKRIKQLVSNYYPLLVFLLGFLIIFRKVMLSGLVPFPGDLLVSFFFPYNSGGWEGFVQYVAHKEFISADVVRQIYPWRILSMDLLKQGSIPLWNPYAFSGSPLIANIQSAVFYPLNALFLLFRPHIAWITYILLQPILGAWFMYLFVRSLRLSKISGIIAGFAFAFIGYNIVWLELGVVGHTALWLPLSLYAITRFADSKNKKYLIIMVLALSFTLVAGHAQTAVYVYLISFAYYLYYLRAAKFCFREMVSLLWVFMLAISLAAIQLLPSFELLQNSARDAATSAEVFYAFQVPPHHLVMLLAPDFFGNPAGKNFWGIEYDEFLCSIGVIALLFSTIGIFQGFKHSRVRFFLFTGIIALIFALPNGISALLQILNVPILGTGLPSRTLFVLQFSGVVLTAFGVEEVLQKRISLKPIALLASLYAALWFMVLSGVNLIFAPHFTENIAIAKRNLILPTALFISAGGLLIVTKRIPRIRYIVLFFCLFLAIFEYQYQVYKYLPFAPESFMFPNHTLVSYLKRETPPFRIQGYDTAQISTNFATEYRILSPEGYDPLYLRRYGELMYGAETGHYERLIPRSDAVFTPSLPKEDSPAKQKLMNLLGVKYVIDKNDAATGGWEPEVDRFPSDRYLMHWQGGKYKVYENLKSLPRSAVFYNWKVITEDEQALNTFLAKDFPYRDSLLLSENPPMTASAGGMISPAQITSYKPNEVIIEATASTSGMLFLSDAYYPGWQAYVDTVKTKLYRADYTLRAVPLQKGRHTVIMKYEPMSFMLGAWITGISAIILGIYASVLMRKSRPNHEKTIAKK